MMRLIEAFGHSCKALRELFLPRHCLVCGSPLSTGDRDLCPDCTTDLPLTYFWDWIQNPAFERIARLVPVESAASLFFFRPEAGYNKILHDIKYNGNVALGYRLGFQLGSCLRQKEWFAGVDAVVPVPLHPLRRFRRGYNQAEAIAAGIAAAIEKPLVTTLSKRVRYTVTQTRLHGGGKKRNVSGAFSMDSTQSKKMTDAGIGHILLVDDVLTSGATLSECARPLLKEFKVSVASLAFVE